MHTAVSSQCVRSPVRLLRETKCWCILGAANSSVSAGREMVYGSLPYASAFPLPTVVYLYGSPGNSCPALTRCLSSLDLYNWLLLAPSQQESVDVVQDLL